MRARENPSLDVDLLILGGGLAGLSLAAALVRNGYQGRARVLEPRTEYSDDRSWAFWTRDTQVQRECIEQRWSQWQIGAAGEAAYTRAAQGWRYCYVRSESVYCEARRQIEESSHIALSLGRTAGGVYTDGNALRVETDQGPIFAAQVVDTRPPSAQRRAEATLFQVFAGRELAADHDCFDPHSAELMTDLRCDLDGLVFSYVLPLTRRHALVEVTRFATRALLQSALQSDLDLLIAKRGWGTAWALRQEYAVLPMGLPAAAKLPTGAVRAGVGAGALRAASGYGFLRIRNWAELCAASLTQGGKALGHPPEPKLRRWMDALFLQVLRREPDRAPELFLKLARGVSGATFVRFMSDCANLSDYARVIAALPPAPFLRALMAGSSLSTRRAH